MVKGLTHKDSKGQYLQADQLNDLDNVTIAFEKMSKSKGNGIIPQEMSKLYGVDTLRVAMLFGAPPESDLNFDEKLLQSCKKYLDKV